MEKKEIEKIVNEEIFILPRNAAIGIYWNLKNQWLDRDRFYEETKTVLTKIREHFNLE